MAKGSLVHRVQTQEKAVAFTFDDGPHPVFTEQVLEIFRQVNGKATFCMIGQEIDKFGDIAAKVHAAGHEMANHTYSHPDLTRFDAGGSAGGNPAGRRADPPGDGKAGCELPAAVLCRE
ncbi:polysaccharide deacetylase family protein [Paenibacillus macerans]|uniref:polysaccharide deacetylase family protein n=1 Tax=Paenibacillus macerans TaxID=44252 RepID=UPI003D31B7D2